MDRLIKKLFGDDLIRALNQMVDEFVELDFDEKDIYKSIKDINESVRTCLYLICEERGLNDLAFKIDKINKRLKVEGVEKFKKVFDEGEVDKYLKKISKTDKMDLLHDMGLDVASDMVYKLDKIKQVYRDVLSKSIKEDQANEHKNGINTFVKYTKEDKVADNKKANANKMKDKKTTK